MLQFHCSACGKQVQGDESLAGKSVLCPVCNRAIAKDAVPVAASSTEFREGLPPCDPPMRSIRKIAPGVLTRWTPYLFLAALASTFVLLMIPSVQKACEASLRTESTNNLKQIGLAFHRFHDANKRLPYNGTAASYQVNGVNFGGPALAGDNSTGSWAFMILPHLDHNPMFLTKDTDAGVSVFMCPARGRPSLCTGAGGSGAWTDYFLNSFINDPNGDFNAQDSKVTFEGIKDGTAATILLAHGQIKPADYGATNSIPGFTDVIFNGGSRSLCRPNQIVVHSRDSADSVPGNWGGPFTGFSLVGKCDATVCAWPYSISGGTIINGVSAPLSGFGIYLTPSGGEPALMCCGD